MKKRKALLFFAMLLILSAACAQASSIRLDSTGRDVEELQEMLFKLGYYSGSITGHAGEKTIEAIEDFQEKYGLKVDGIAGTETMNKIRSILDPNYKPVSSSSSQAGSSDVEMAQVVLKEMGIYSGQITGNIGSKTTAAIKAFQKKYGLEQSGNLNSATLAKLQSVYSGGSAENSAPQNSADMDDVKAAQTMLKSMDLYYGEITGKIGSKTTAAIKAFQKKYGLEQSGNLNSATMAKLQSVYSGGKEENSSSQNNADTDDIKAAQTMLKSMDLYYGEITGNIGSKTTAAIKAFQKKYGLEQDGNLNSATLAKLYSVYADENDEDSEQQSASVEDVSRAQTILKALGLYYGDVTGNVGTKTKAAIEKFQKEYGLTADGLLGSQTLAMLESVYGEINEDEEAETGEFTSLRFGSTGTNVSILQENLTRLGYYYGDVTGNYGTKTRAAVRSFQKKYGLTADGIAGQKTFAAVQAAVDQLGLPDIEDVEDGGAVLDLHWFNEKSFYNKHGVKAGLTMTVMDIVTGKMFNVRVQSTGFHADVEPKTAQDTQIMCDIYGVDDADDISWKRRAILVKTNMGGGNIYTYAASMYGEPHGSQVITDNNYDGQFCIHFRHSTTSETKIEYADNQDPIDKAVNYAVSKMGMRHVTDPDDL